MSHDLTLDLPDISPHDAFQPQGLATPEQIKTLDAGSRVSYYIQAWQEMLETVYAFYYYSMASLIDERLDNESYLFTSSELKTLERWSQMSCWSLVLFIRKNGYFRVNNLTNYARDVDDMSAACKELCSFRPFTKEEAAVPVDPGSPLAKHIAVFPASTSRVTLDDDSDDDATPPAMGCIAEDGTNLEARRDVGEMCSMLTLEDLKILAKDFGLSPPKETKKGKYIVAAWTRASIVQALKKNTSNQATLFSAFSQAGDQTKSVGLQFSRTGQKLKQSDLLIERLLKTIGPVIKLDPSIMQLFSRLHLIYHRCAPPQNAHSMTAALLARFEKRNYPQYQMSRGFSVFSSRKALLDYEKAITVERDLEEALEFATSSFGGYRPNATTDEGAFLKDKDELDEEVSKWRQGRSVEKRIRWQKVEELFEEAWQMWSDCIRNERDIESPSITAQEDRLTYYKRRFHPGWPLTRAVHKGTACLAISKQYDREVFCLKALLAQTYFRRGRRGQWWDRLALIHMEHGVSGSTESMILVGQGSDDEIIEVTTGKPSQLQCRKEALKICWQGLEDPWTHLVERHALQRRINRLESLLKVAKPKRHVFHDKLSKATEVYIKGKQLGDKVSGRKSSWQSTIDDKEETVSVEDLSLEHYAKDGWKGYHAENSILTTMFGMLFWDVLFQPVEAAFETPYQTNPLDLYTDAFSIVRAESITQRLQDIQAGKAPEIIQIVDERERGRATWCVGVKWSFTPEDLQDFAKCIGPDALCMICRVYAEDYEHRNGGVPDLFLWKPEVHECRFVEVKGPGDSLSKTQKVWIDLLLASGIEVEKCNVKSSISAKRKVDNTDDAKKDLRAYTKRVRSIKSQH